MGLDPMPVLPVPAYTHDWEEVGVGLVHPSVWPPPDLDLMVVGVKVYET